MAAPVSDRLAIVRSVEATNVRSVTIVLGTEGVKLQPPGNPPCKALMKREKLKSNKRARGTSLSPLSWYIEPQRFRFERLIECQFPYARTSVNIDRDSTFERPTIVYSSALPYHRWLSLFVLPLVVLDRSR